jgi:hypothetical protein
VTILYQETVGVMDVGRWTDILNRVRIKIGIGA